MKKWKFQTSLPGYTNPWLGAQFEAATSNPKPNGCCSTPDKDLSSLGRELDMNAPRVLSTRNIPYDSFSSILNWPYLQSTFQIRDSPVFFAAFARQPVDDRFEVGDPFAANHVRVRFDDPATHRNPTGFK